MVLNRVSISRIAQALVEKPPVIDFFSRGEYFRQQSMPITTKEIAKICNVSRGTVDRALNGRLGISSVTGERIHAVARQYDYRPHLIASSLSRGKSMSLGVVIFDINLSAHYMEMNPEPAKRYPT
jgi:hypothetical protein